LEASEPEAKPIVTFDMIVIRACSLMFYKVISIINTGHRHGRELTK
jgi:hypothetical protein